MGLRVDSLEEIYPIADFIADAFGGLAEIVVHDVVDLESSIVYIRNGHLSGRKIGDGTTDAALRLIESGLHGSRDYLSSYTGKALGGRTFRSSTYFVRDRSETLVGLLCVNIDVSGLGAALDALQSLVSNETAARPSEQLGSFEENLQGDPSETIRRITRSALSDLSVSPDRMTRQQRLDVIERIKGEGVFLMKGAVNIVAPELSVSVPTLYRYLQEVKER